MSDPSDAKPGSGAKWVPAKVVDDDAPPTEPDRPLAEAADPADASAATPPDRPQLSDDDIRAARWFSIAFLSITIPVAFLFIAVMLWVLFVWLPQAVQ